MIRFNFQNEHTVYETIIRCKVKEREFNFSTNSTLTLPSGDIKSFAVSDEFQPYFTTIGIYNDKKELIMIAKTNQPFPISRVTDTIIDIRYDQ